ncbi:MAG: ATP-binding protein [Marinosulfonomonas sp.]
MNLMEEIAKERRARLAAEHLLKLKQEELFAANAELSKHALALTGEIVVQREEVQNVQSKAKALEGEKERVLEDLENANEAINIAERRLWDSVETIEDGFAVFDNADTLVAANSAYLSVFDGLECVAPGISYFDVVRLMVEEGIVDIGNEPSKDWVQNICTRWRSDTLEPTVLRLWNGQFIKLVDRRSEGGDTVSLALNITDTIRNEKTLKDARLKAETANQAKSAFLAKMSHELRTPMNGVVGMADLLADSPLNDEQKLFVDTIKTSGEALLELINDVLDFSKIEAAKLVLHLDTFDLERCIHDVILLFQPAVQTKDIDLDLDFDLFLPTEFVGDSGRIRQILTNLIGNAVKFTPNGHVVVRVVGIPDQSSDEIRLHITVEDTGLGIPSDKIDHIFGEFNQVEDEKNRKFEGTGLGLAITKQLIGLMGGEIWVDSEEGVGSNFGFHITLPTTQKDQSMPTAVPDWIRRVGIIESNSLAADTLKRQLTALGLEVIEIDSTDKTGQTRPDLLVLDCTTNLEIDPDTRCILDQVNTVPPIVLLPAGVSESSIDMGKEFVPLYKPYSRSALIQTVASLKTPQADEPPAARKMRILAAEDNKTNRLVFSKLVKALNIDLSFAENGAIAVAKWQEEKPDLVFMDISMPEMDGKEATRAIRAQEAKDSLPHTPIVALTAHAMAGDDNEILAAGLDHYLTKPLKKDEIFERIRAAIPAGALTVFPDTEGVSTDISTSEPQPIRA